MSENRYYATGKRKTAVARVWMKPGSGSWAVNDRGLMEYFQSDSLVRLIRQPLETTGKRDAFDFYINVRGGGISGQAGAVKHGISKALVEYDEALKSVLKKAGFLTRDARIKERKKYG